MARPSPPKRRNAFWRFLRHHVKANAPAFDRLARPDFWGPVSPALLRRYGVTYDHGDLTRLPYGDGTFDAASCISVLEHMPRDARLAGLAEMARVVRPGGRLIVTYDVMGGEDLTDEFITASGCTPIELVYFRAAARLFAPNGVDVVGMVLRRH